MPRKKRRRFYRKRILETESYADIVFDHLGNILFHLIFVFSLFIVLLPVFAFLLTREKIVFFVCLAIVFITSPLTFLSLKSYRHFDIKEFKNSILFLSKDENIQSAALLAANFLLFLRFGLQTMIPIISLILLFILSSLMTFTSMPEVRLRKKIIRSFLVVPFFINLLITFNYLLSFNPTKESYKYSFNYQLVKGYSYSNSYQRSTLISLKNNKYQAYPGIRMFWNFDKMRYGNNITYTFREGILGIKVMTDYEF